MDPDGPKEVQVQSPGGAIGLVRRHGMAHWRQPEHTIDPAVCGGDAALCKITSTTCFCFRLSRMFVVLPV